MTPALLVSGDPVALGRATIVVVAIVVVKALLAFGMLMTAVALMIWFERKLISDMQNRVGPNRAGPFGLLQTMADGIKLMFKEDLLPEGADRATFRLAPFLSTVPAFLSFAIVPVGGVVHLFGYTTELQVADPPIGILFLLAMSGVAVYGLMLAGWSSGSKYPLLGSVRASAQMVSYEAAMGLSVAAVVLVTGSLSTRAIVQAQAAHIWDWNLVRLAVIPFVIFLAAATAELNRPPFDLVEGDSELVGGFNTEYSSMRFGLFYLAEFMSTITMSAVIVTLFLGGPDGPVIHLPLLNWLMPIGWFFLKTLAFLFFYVWLRAALPRLRYDQLMDLGWKVLIQAALGWLIVIAGFRVGRVTGLVTFAVAIVVGAGMARAFAVGQVRNRDPATSSSTSGDFR